MVQTITATAPSPNTTPNKKVCPLVINEYAPPVATTLGVVLALDVGDPDAEEVSALELEVFVPAAELCADPDADEDAGDDAGDEDDVGVVVGVDEGVELGGVELGLGLELELEPELPTGTTAPPCTLPAELDEDVPAAFAL